LIPHVSYNTSTTQLLLRERCSLELAVQLFRACNDKATDETVQQFFYYYNSWKRCEDGIHLGVYYNMVAKKYMYNNGSRRNQLEIADSMSHDVFTGFGHYYTKALPKNFIIFVLMYTIKNKQGFTFCIICYRSIEKVLFHFTNGLLSYFNQSKSFF